MKKILFIFGTRPEAIKMAPIVKEFAKHSDKFLVKTCVTAQHRLMLDQVLSFFDIIPDFDLDLMKPNQNLYDLTANVISGMRLILEEFKPDYVMVHGDTTTSTASSLAAFYAGCKVCHVEAGLRTNNKFSPFPEEMNRQLTARLTDIHFAPTEQSRQNLIAEGISDTAIHVVGNSVIDALFFTIEKLNYHNSQELDELKKGVDDNKKIILVTGHRRENFGDSFLELCYALKDLSYRENIQIVYPVHLNPNVQGPVYKILSDLPNISLIQPLSYPSFVWLMNKSYIILSDSGGIQEEAPSLKKPVLVMRDTTERPEALSNGNVILVGTNRNLIVSNVDRLLCDTSFYKSFSKRDNPYGQGDTAVKIAKLLSLMP